MKKTVIALAILLLAGQAYGQSYLLDMERRSGGLSLENVSLTEVEPRENIGEGQYVAILESFNGTELERRYFNAPVTMSALTMNPNVTPEHAEDTVSVLVPYHPAGNLIEVRDTSDNSIEFTAYVSEYASCDQDAACETGETADNCPSDCGGKPEDEQNQGFLESLVEAVTGFLDWLIPL
ncbi:MAG: hypothetical protein ABEJ98_05925 [Candidatus Nanohaloarchaea archaeon]